MSEIKEVQLLDLSEAKKGLIANLKKFEKDQKQLVKDNPYIEIVDRETYEEAKKRRTALVKGRTGFNEQEKVIKQNLNGLKKDASDYINDVLIPITKPFEDKQQEEVKRWEAELEKKREEKAEQERQRIQLIRDKSDLFEATLSAIIVKMNINNIKEQKLAFEETIEVTKKETDFEEYEIVVDEMINRQREDFDEKVSRIKEAENNRIQQLKARQKAEIDKHYQVATRMVQECIIEDSDTLVERVKKSFETDFDFGDASKEQEQSKAYVLNIAVKRVNELEAMKEQWSENKKNQMKLDQMEALQEWQGRLLNQINLMTTTNYESLEINLDELDQASKLYDLIPEKFSAFASTIGDMQKEKIEGIKSKIASENKEREKIAEERFEMMVMIGMKRHEGTLVGFNQTIGEKVIEYSSNEEFNDLLNKIQSIKAEIENNEARRMALSEDVKKIQTFLADTQDSIDWNKVLPSLDHSESIEYVNMIKSELNLWFGIKYEGAERI